MQKFKFEVLKSTSYAKTLAMSLATSLIASLALAPTTSMAMPMNSTKKPASDGMAIKLVSARNYHGAKLPKHKAEIVKRMPKSKPQVVTVRGAGIPVTVAANSKKTIIPKREMEKIAIPQKAVAKPAIAANGTSHTTALDNVEKTLAAPRLKKAPVQQQQQVQQQVVEKDLVDSLDRLPLESAKTAAPAGQMLQTRISGPSATTAPMFSPIVQFKNRLTTGRKYELEEIGGKNFSRKHEVVLGAKHSSGFGAALSGSVSASSFDDTTKDKQTTGDITMLLYQPSWYKAGPWDVTGFGRIYFPTSDASKTTNKFHYLYSLGTTYDFGGGFRLENGLTPHYWTQNQFADDDTFFLLEEELMAKYDLAPWVTIGAGPYVQVDSHERSAPGTSVEITPVIGFNIDHVYFESKMYLPIYTDGQVGGGPTNASLSQIAGEFYLKLFL